MPLAELLPTDTRPLFRPVSTRLVDLLAGLDGAAWHRPTIAGAWTVRDIVAHLTDGALRRLSFHRDRMPPPAPEVPILGERDFARFINNLNAQWVTVARRFSPQVLTALFAQASAALADWFEQLPFDAPALFPVSWAGENESAGWFDVGREFTEVWHHQQQIRLALGAPSLDDPRFLHAVLEIAVRGLPHACRGVAADSGATVVLSVGGAAGGDWTLLRDEQKWNLRVGTPARPTTIVRLTDDMAWRLLFNALSRDDAKRLVQIDGDARLGEPLLAARSVIV
jgi:uncharacterized protein (TIGR03083 family)